MIFPTIRQVREKMRYSRNDVFIRPTPFTTAESLKINDVLKNKKSMLQPDSEAAFQRFLYQIDSVFGEFITKVKDKIILRGKLEYKGLTRDPETGENQLVFTISDPKSLYRHFNTEPIFIRTSQKRDSVSGIYAEVEFEKNDKQPFFVDANNIKPIEFEPKVPLLFLDYEKFTDSFRFDYGFYLSDIARGSKRGFELSRVDLLLLNKIAGENFHNEVKGGVNFNIIKTTRDQGTYELEVLDNFLDAITFNQNSGSVFNKNLIHAGVLSDFKTILNKSNRELLTSTFKNYYGCNIGFSLGRTLAKEDNFIDKLSDTCVDYINPIDSVIMKSKSSVEKMLRTNRENVFSSRALFLETQLLPIKAKVYDIKDVKPSVLRMATMLKKFEECIDNLGNDEILSKVNLNETSVDHSNQFLKDNRKDVNDFIKDL